MLSGENIFKVVILLLIPDPDTGLTAGRLALSLKLPGTIRNNENSTRDIAGRAGTL